MTVLLTTLDSVNESEKEVWPKEIFETTDESPSWKRDLEQLGFVHSAASSTAAVVVVVSSSSLWTLDVALFANRIVSIPNAIQCSSTISVDSVIQG